MTDAARWAAEHGFTDPHVYRNDCGESLCELPDAERGVTHSGVIHERWSFSDASFSDASSIVLRHVFWELEQQ